MPAFASLSLGLGDNSILISCHDPALRNTLRRYFYHCVGEMTHPVARYEVTREENGIMRLSRDGEVLYDGGSTSFLIELLMQNVTEALTSECRNHMVFHAAGISKGYAGIIVCGESGTGKSTLAAWLTAKNFDFLTDELVAVSLDLKSMTGFPRPIGLKSGSAFVWQHWLDDAARENLLHLSDNAVLLDPELLRFGCVRDSAQPKIIIFPRYVSDVPFVSESLSAGEGLFLLMQRLINARNLPDHGFSLVTALAQQTTLYRLTYPDIHSAVQWIEQQLSG